MDIDSAFASAFTLVVHFDSKVLEIVALSFQVRLCAVGVASLIGLPIGAGLAVLRFPGRTFIIISLNAMMGMPPVVVGLLFICFCRGLAHLVHWDSCIPPLL